MAVESITLVKAEDLPSDIRAENNLPDEGLIEVRVERNSDPTPTFKVLKDHLKSMDELRGRLAKEGKLKKV